MLKSTANCTEDNSVENKTVLYFKQAARMDVLEMSQEDTTADIYAQIGSDAPFYALVEHFYASVETDALLRPMYPSDLTLSKRHMALFFIQRFGGSTQYDTERGHPRLRMRHVPFRIGPQESAAWLRHMSDALDAVPELAPFRAELDRYFVSTAVFLVNRTEVPAISLSE